MNKKWEHLMVDLETMGKQNNAAIVQIGACMFDMQTCEIGPTFLKNIHLATAMAHGGTVDASTINFWLGQSEAARNSIRFGGEDIGEVLTEFTVYVEEHSSVKDVLIYGNSPRFDMEKLETAYLRLDMKAPWYWSHERCFRTIRHQHPKVVYDTDDKGDTAHNALADAIFQAKHLFKIKNFYKKT